MIKQFITSISLVIFPIMLFGQSNFSVGINLGSELSFMNITESKAEELGSGIYEEGGIGIGYSIGIQTEYEIQNSLFLRSGFLYEHSSHRHLIKGLVFVSDLGNGTTSTMRNRITISSIGIPLDIGYRFSTKNENLKVLLGIGGILNINLKNKSDGEILHEGSENENLSNVKNDISESNISGLLFTGIEFGVNEKLVLGIEPHIKYTPNDFTLYLYESTSQTKMEVGMTIRLRMK